MATRASYFQLWKASGMAYDPAITPDSAYWHDQAIETMHQIFDLLPDNPEGAKEFTRINNLWKIVDTWMHIYTILLTEYNNIVARQAKP